MKDEGIFWPVLTRDMTIIILTFFSLGFVLLILGLLAWSALKEMRFFQSEIRTGILGVSLVLVMPSLGIVSVTRLLTNRYGIKCQACGRPLSVFFMKPRHKRIFYSKRACPYCEEVSSEGS